MKQPKRRLLVVLGMHRSGTSAITRGLQALGVDLGQRLMPPVKGNNDKGFFEDVDLNALNIDLLKLFGHDWDTLSPTRLQTFNDTNLDAYKRAAIDLLQAKMSDRPFAIKDPRIVRLLPFWRSVFSELAADVSFVIALRNPVSVAASLLERDGIAAEKSYVLWLQHVIPAVLQTSGSRRIIVDFDSLMDAPFLQLARIADSLDLPMPARDSASAAEYENEFLDPRLRHTRFSAAELRLDGRAPSSVSRLYQLLSNAANDRDELESPDFTKRLMEIETGLLSISPFLDYASRLEDDIRLEKALLQAANGQLSSAHGRIDSLNAKLAAVQQELETSQEKYESELNSAQGEIDMANGHVLSLSQQIGIFQRQAAQFDAMLRHTGAELATSRTQIESLQRSVVVAESRVAEMLASTSWRVTKGLRFISQLVRGRPLRMRSRTAQLFQPRSSTSRPGAADVADNDTNGTHGPTPRVSAVLPNYNYARYLRQRIESITSQTLPPFEIVVLDDSSTDESVEVIRACLRQTTIAHRLVRNEHNSGSVFAQWRKGVELARGEFVWICEADDFAEPRFLERVVGAFEDPSIVLSYSQSRRVDESGITLAKSYDFYTDDIDERRWRSDYACTGEEELQSALAIKNTIPNVSAVVFRRASLIRALIACESELKRLKIAGDWLVYAELLRTGGLLTLLGC